MAVKNANTKEKKKKNKFIYANGKTRKPRWPFVILAIVIAVFCIENLVGDSFIEMVQFFKENPMTASEVVDSLDGEIDLTENSETVSQSETQPTTITSGKYKFKSKETLDEKFKENGKNVGADTAEKYQAMACDVITNNKSMQKENKKDSGTIYFLQSKGEIVFLSKDGYITDYYITDYQTYKNM